MSQILSLFACCGCGSKDPHGEDERLRGTDDDVYAGELSLSVFAAMWCRSSGMFALEKTLGQVGTRQRKAFCYVTRTSGDPQHDGDGGGMWSWFPGSRTGSLVLTVTQCAVGAHERYHVQRALELSRMHPLLLPILAVELPRTDRLVIVREWCRQGSLRDVIHGASPSQSVHAKYDRVGSPLSERKCASVGRAILDALRVLRPLGARACLHVHCGNIFFSGEQPKLAEWEQGLLGMPSHLADFVNDLKRALEPAAASLALCLYEMACGFELDGLPAVFPPSCPRAVRDTLEVMLRAPPAKERRPPRTLEDALELPLFTLLEAVEGVYASTVGARAGPRADEAWPPPLSDAVLQHAAHVTSARGDPSA